MSENQNFQKTKAITTASQNKEKYHEEQRRTHSENKPLDKPLEARVNASHQVPISFNLIGLESVVSFFGSISERNKAKQKRSQGVKLRLIQAPMRLNFSLWRPNPES